MKLQQLLQGETMRKTICVLALLLALTGSAYAGEMPQPVAPPTTPTTVVPGDMPQPLTQSIVAVIETVLSLV
jgi:hypothetical protein